MGRVIAERPRYESIEHTKREFASCKIFAIRDLFFTSSSHRILQQDLSAMETTRVWKISNILFHVFSMRFSVSVRARTKSSPKAKGLVTLDTDAGKIPTRSLLEEVGMIRGPSRPLTQYFTSPRFRSGYTFSTFIYIFILRNS